MKTWILAVMVLAGVVGAGPAAGPAQQKAPEYKYRGRQVSQQWIDQAYKEFKPLLAVVDGKVTDIGKTRVASKGVPMNPPDDGTVVIVHGEVLEVNGDVAIVRTGLAAHPITVKLEGVDGQKLADGAIISHTAMFIGNRAEGSRTLQTYRIVPQPTKEEFADALRGGLVLVRYKRDEFGKFTEQKVP